MSATALGAATAGFLADERATLAGYAPELATSLAESSLLELERPGGDAIATFKRSAAPALVVPRERGGLGATPLDAVRFQRAVGSFAPSLAVATTMHHFSQATLVEFCRQAGEVEWLVIEGMATRRMLFASGFAEGRSGAGVLSPTMTAREAGDAYVVTGVKKPCSLSRSMDLLIASVRVERHDGTAERGVALVAADSPGLEREPFWASRVLGAAESDAVILNDVEVPRSLVFANDDDGDESYEEAGFLWFELLVTASYLGIASALAERALARGKGDLAARAALGVELESSMSALAGVARSMEAGESATALLPRALFVRYAAQEAIARAARSALELLGGMAFAGSDEVPYLVAATQALALHPPPRAAASAGLVEVLAGGEFALL